MKVLVVGGGGREHAIIRKLRESPQVTDLLCAPGNGGIAADATCFPVGATDLDGMLALARDQKVDFAVVAPDDPLALGMVDAMEAAGIPAFGPDKAAARIEASKVFSKDLMKRHNIPTARYECFTDAAAALDYVRALDEYPVVIKADGLALGKGVVIAQNLPEAEAAIRGMLEEGMFGASGSEIVIEQFLTGPEVSVLAFCDGNTLVPMVSSMDHKRIFDGNQGPNTGGMGTIAPNPHYTPEMAARCEREIFEPTVRAMREEGYPFRGCLYFGLMLTANGPVVIEYNCRFGDPETQVVLPLLESDLLDIFRACRDGRLHELDIRWKSGAAACVVLASGGYPGPYEKGTPIHGLGADGQLDGPVAVHSGGAAAQADAVVYHAGTTRTDSGYATNGGRVLGVTATGATLDAALAGAYAAVDGVSWQGMQYRKDIGRY